MPLKLLIDENLRGRFTYALETCPLTPLLIDVVEVGSPGGPPCGTKDPDLLVWAQKHGRVLVSLDHESLPTHLAHHLAAGCFSPGIILLRPARPWDELVDIVVLAAVIGTPEEFADQLQFLP